MVNENELPFIARYYQIYGTVEIAGRVVESEPHTYEAKKT